MTAVVPGPVMRAMEQGAIARVEELTRIPADVQDALISILSEKTLPIPELDDEVQALQGFNVIATANNRDKGVNDLSSALRRRFNTVVLPLPDSLDRGGGDRPHPGSLHRQVPGIAAGDRGAGGDRTRGDDLPRTAVGHHAQPADHSEVAERDPLNGRGDLGDDQRRSRWPPTSATA